ncbi:MAG: hypothetical protein C0600_14560 [Ignavibacteria bacterium]|nr:MAG: hypothetical protein C0600_14560 [Ignavibacteria bacterium]
MGTAHHIGLEIAERSFRFVEIQQQDRQTTILRADTLETAHDYASPLLFDLPFDRDLARSFITDLASVYHQHTVYAGSISLVLPSMLPLVCTVPVDRKLSAEERREQVEWECRTLGGLAENVPLSILSHTITSNDEIAITLAVALPQSTVDFLTQTCEHLTLDLHAIDIDQFTMEKMIQLLYPHEAKNDFAVLGLHEKHCSAGRYSSAQYHGCRLGTVSYKQHYPAQAVRLLESLPIRQSTNGPGHVYVFGNAAETHLTDAIEDILKCSVTRCVPLADTHVPDAIRDGFQLKGERLFDAAAAAGLLGLS